jgi:signal transduction histidine kinase/CheY-like chemotaxis protein
VKSFDWLQLLRNHSVLSSLDENHVQWLVSDTVSTERRYDPGVPIFREGDEGDSVFLIGSGSVEAVIEVGAEQSVLLSVMYGGETFGEMAFFEGKPRSATVRARDACVVLEIEGRALRRVAETRRDVELEMLLTVSERLRNKNEQRLALHLKAVESANRAKDEFFAMLGHELRNPLGAISTAVEVLNQPGNSEEQVARLREIIVRQTQHLSRLVDDLLDVSKLVSGKVALERTVEDLQAVVEGALVSCKEAGKMARHVILFEGESVPVSIDRTRMEQVVTNLLDNAVKYTPAGGRIELKVASEGGDAVLRVRDTGVGVDRETLPLIFDIFVQASPTHQRSEAGIGLGLTLVKRLVELHGGTVSAASDGPGRGAEFVVRLPRTASAKVMPRPQRGQRSSSRARHVLIVEDNEDVRDCLRMLLEAWGHRVEQAEDGNRGLEVLRASHPEVLLVDLGLPGIDGHSIARAARSAPDGERLLLVAISGYGAPTDRRRAEEAGFNAYLTKPVDADELSEILRRGSAPVGLAGRVGGASALPDRRSRAYVSASDRAEESTGTRKLRL